jgi:hypothetical protein
MIINNLINIKNNLLLISISIMNLRIIFLYKQHFIITKIKNDNKCKFLIFL